jgi:phage major head subunit gpT-like protein
MIYKPDELITKGVRAELAALMEPPNPIWERYCERVTSNTKTEAYAWSGTLPRPRKYVDQRTVQGMRAYDFSITNEKWELTFIINRDHWEDDQTGQIQSRVREAALPWAAEKNEEFKNLLVNGATSTATYDGSTFFHATRTDGESGTIDNNLTSAAATGTIPTSAEFMTGVKDSKTQMLKFKDDMGRPWTNMVELWTIVPPAYEHAAREGLNATVISQTSNVFQGMSGLDVYPYLTSEAIMYVCALNGPRKPFVYQERTALEIVILDSTEDFAENEGLKVLCRQRFKFAYGEFRAAIEYTYS